MLDKFLQVAFFFKCGLINLDCVRPSLETMMLIFLPLAVSGLQVQIYDLRG